MTTAYRTEHAAEPAAYGRLMAERYGPLPQLLTERHRPTPPRSPALPPTTDPHAARHRAELVAALRTPGRTATPAERNPPYPGAVWCNSCDSWCTPHGVCRCNNR